jgi:hypothetical protein
MANQNFSDFLRRIGEFPIYDILQKITKPGSALEFFARENALDQRAAFVLGRIPRNDYGNSTMLSLSQAQIVCSHLTGKPEP